ncbi:MAG TPA: hypothetical protein VIF02_15095 [Methylocella sp.]|jgi:hypothetical protein
MNLENTVKNHVNGAKVQALASGETGALLEMPKKPRRTGFQPENRANPRGRPRGAFTHKANPLRRLMDSETPAILKAMIEKAKAGDTAAASIILTRSTPRERLFRIQLPRIIDAGSALAALGLLVDYVASGLLTASEAESVGKLCKGYLEISLIEKLEGRIAAIEQRQGNGR